MNDDVISQQLHVENSRDGDKWIGAPMAPVDVSINSTGVYDKIWEGQYPTYKL